jgi:hypothetical protein
MAVNKILAFKQNDDTWDVGFVHESGAFVVVSAGHPSRAAAVRAILDIMHPRKLNQEAPTK